MSTDAIIRRSAERGRADHGWLRSFHTFSFADYYDPEHMGFRALRVINEDRVQPATGFGTHPHRDMEILTYVLEGALEHQDSMGNGSIIQPGDVQRMSAGTGVLHSELNPSRSDPVHLLQIWIIPDRRGLPPSYEQRSFPPEERAGRLRLIASQDGRDGSVTVHQDVSLYSGLFEAGESVQHRVAPERHVWIQVAKGEIELDGVRLFAGDAAAFSEPTAIEISSVDRSEVLLFDLS